MGALRISVAAPPDRGKANEEVRRLLADRLALPPSCVQVISGFGSRDKLVEIESLEPDEVRRRLSAVSR